MVKVSQDLTGMKFGKWTVLYQAEDIIRPSGIHNQAWMCRCECGKIKKVDGYTLKQGKSTNCGCSGKNIHQFNEYEIKEGKVYIKLTQGQTCIIDAEDLEKVKKYRWVAVKDSHNNNLNYYVIASSRGASAKKGINRTLIRMHNLIMGCKYIDHKDGNGLNNTKENLRPYLEPSQNCVNISLRKDNKIGYVGVYSSGKRWFGRVSKNNIDYRTQLFITKEDAAEARDIIALKLFGEFAKLNFEEKREEYMSKINSH